MAIIKSIIFKDDKLKLIDQRKLPTECVFFECYDYREVVYAIREMVVRGAPAIGAAAAYGMFLGAMEFNKLDYPEFAEEMKMVKVKLDEARPTAVNLMWATSRMMDVVMENAGEDVQALVMVLFNEAGAILEEDIQTNKAMAHHGNKIVPKKATILTHCNTGSLATAGYGTALGVIREAYYSGKDIFVYADETRPRLQGSRLTAWELKEENIPSRLIPDSVAATLIRDGKIDMVLVGADRIASNGDTANKIGTFMLSVVAKTYNVPFYVVAPTTTVDFDIQSGDEIVIEERSAEEVTHIKGVSIAPDGVEVYNPAFDVTPNANITGIITEKGIIMAPFGDKISDLKG